MRCSLCQAAFLPDDSSCPGCGAEPEDRLLAWLLDRLPVGPPGGKLLAVAPSAALANYYTRKFPQGELKVTAIHHALRDGRLHPPHRSIEMDVTHMTFSDHCFDVVVAGGVLPFVRSDYLAMSEMHRCLKTAGVVALYVNLPWAKTRRAADVRAEEPGVFSREFFERHGTEWVYGEDFFERLEAAGFFVHRLGPRAQPGPEWCREQSVPVRTELVLCFKFRDSMEAFLASVKLR